jgi:FAD:protein FMN transferase
MNHPHPHFSELSVAVASTVRTWKHESRDLYHGIPVTITARDCPEKTWQTAWDLLVDADAVFNRFAPTSELSRLAAMPDGTTAQLSTTLAAGIRAALHAFRISHGYSDASIRPLVALWRSAVDQQRWPEADAITEARKHCRLHELTIDEHDRLLVTGPSWCVDLDLGGVIKGVLVDWVARLLHVAGSRHFLVQIGGETTALGFSQRDRPWRIGIQHPCLEAATWMVLSVPDGGISCSTSADYRRGWAIHNQSVSHLINPRTGQPASPDLLTAHVAIPHWGRCGDAEALTKVVALADLETADAILATQQAEWLHLEAVEQGIAETQSAAMVRFGVTS